MAEGDKTPGGEPPGQRERDILAERRARRAESSDPALARRAETAEATVSTLESHLADLRQRLRETEAERQRSTEQLLEREQEVRRVKQREYAEQQLRVEAQEQSEHLRREQRAELDRLQRRLAASERHARELADQLEGVRRELAEAEQAAAAQAATMRRTARELADREADLAGRELALERTRTEIEQRLDEARAAEREARALRVREDEHRQTLSARVETLQASVVEIQREAESARAGREHAETRLRETLEGGARMESLVRELRRIATQLRGSLARPTRAEPDGEEMAKALAAAVERLRARVTAVADTAEDAPRAVEPDPPPPAPPRAAPPAVESPQQAVAPPRSDAELAPPRTDAEPAPAQQDAPLARPFAARVLVPSARRSTWLAASIRQIAEQRDPKLAGELVRELLPAQCQLVKGPLTYSLKIKELGEVHVRLDGMPASVEQVSAHTPLPPPEWGKPAFSLEGPAAAFAELAAGGARRRWSGVRVRGSRRGARRLLAARRTPLALYDLAAADIRVWPGLLLLALGAAIDPEWTRGQRFVLAFAIESAPSATLYLRVHDGEPIAVTRTSEQQPVSTVHLSERAFLCLFAGASLPAREQVLVAGQARPLDLLLGWSDRAQGLA